MKQRLENIMNLLHELQKIDPEFPLQYAVCLCEIAMDEGISLTTLSQRAGMPLSTVSRIVGALAQNRQCGTPYDLVRVTLSNSERRKKELYLTMGGKNLIGSLIGIIDEAASDQQSRQLSA